MRQERIVKWREMLAYMKDLALRAIEVEDFDSAIKYLGDAKIAQERIRYGTKGRRFNDGTDNA